jgi:leucyl-tRNA synthetase
MFTHTENPLNTQNNTTAGSSADDSDDTTGSIPYIPSEIDPKWQQIWEERGLFRAEEGGSKPKFYCLEYFPYPSGEGLHVGHCRNYVPTDVLSRYKRMRGYNVLHPMGWDAFGEPAEQYAVRHGVHPRVTNARNSANFRRQLVMIGSGYDWSREIDSSDPGYYRWTQAIFLLLYKRGLAYHDTNWQWWCPTCQTTLSSHEAVGGVCWRGHPGVIRREIPAWYFRITAYADRLLKDLDHIDWPEKIKSMQRNWIGRSEGVEVIFPFTATLDAASDMGVHTFTTRPDTLFGVTFIVLAPEHPMVAEFTTATQQERVRNYQLESAKLGEIERMKESRPKTGVFTGGYVYSPVTGEAIPVWVADYVLMTYGTGAVMGVPAHDQRDFEFAREFDLPVRAVISPPDDIVEAFSTPFMDEGRMINSGHFSGMTSQGGGQAVTDWLEENGLGKRIVQYRMRDWLISRQRYWGAPIPIIHCPRCGETPVPESDLPVLLPQMDNFTPDGSGRSPLERVPGFVNTTCPSCGGPARRETDTMGGFACSSWYFLRFTSPHLEHTAFDHQSVHYWLPVDLYVGGAEHAVLHLLYSRFWIKVMADAGWLDFDEPFARLLNQGQLMGPDGQRMSKSRGNVITPDSIVETYGADSLRIYEMFMAPFDQDVAWSVEGINGASRFLKRVWELVLSTYNPSAQAQEIDHELEIALHQVIQDITERLETLRLNTMVSTLMTFVNLLYDRWRGEKWMTLTFHQAVETLVILLSPSAPHICEELWLRMGKTGDERTPGSILQQSWPTWNPEITKMEEVEIPVQVNGKLRDVIRLHKDAVQEQAEEAALGSASIQRIVQDGSIRKIIYIPAKVINIVLSMNE